MHVYVLSACLCDSGNSRKTYYQVDLVQLLPRTVLTNLCAHDLNNYVFLRSGFVMKNDHRQEQKLFYVCSPPPNFNVELGWVPNQVVIKNDHLRWTPFCFNSNFEIGGAGVVTSPHASNPRWSFFMTNPGKENCQTNKNPGLKPLIISQHALRIPLQLGSLSSSFFKPLINDDQCISQKRFGSQPEAIAARYPMSSVAVKAIQHILRCIAIIIHIPPMSYLQRIGAIEHSDLNTPAM